MIAQIIVMVFGCSQENEEKTVENNNYYKIKTINRNRNVGEEDRQDSRKKSIDNNNLQNYFSSNFKYINKIMYLNNNKNIADFNTENMQNVYNNFNHNDKHKKMITNTIMKILEIKR
jgi:hypothetical protein